MNDAFSGISGGSLEALCGFVGCSGTGAFTQTGGAISVGSLYLGYNTGDVGTFVQSGGTNVLGSLGALYLGYGSGSNGNYILSGSGLLSAANNEYVGYSGSGAFTQTGGTNNLGYGSLYVGYGSGSSGNYSLTGSGVLSASNENVGYSGTGTFTQTGGTNNLGYDGNLDVGSSVGSRAATASAADCSREPDISASTWAASALFPSRAERIVSAAFSPSMAAPAAAARTFSAARDCSPRPTSTWAPLAWARFTSREE